MSNVAWGGWLLAVLFGCTSSVGGTSGSPFRDDVDVVTDPLRPRIALGDEHGCAVTPDRFVQCWGNNVDRQLSDDLNPLRTTPREVGLVENVAAVAASNGASCALQHNGALWCWGNLTMSAQRGGRIPTRMGNPVPLRSLSMGLGQGCGLDIEGRAWGWGWAQPGQYGGGVSNEPMSVARLAALDGARAVTCGGSGGCAIMADRSVRCWGYRVHNFTETSPVPRSVPQLGNVVQVAPGWGMSCAIVEGGAVSCWGASPITARSPLYIGPGTESFHGEEVPEAVTLPMPAMEVSVGTVFGCARLQNGRVWCWGADEARQHGTGPAAPSHAPTEVAGLGEVMPGSLVARAYRACARTLSGEARCWGYDPIGRHGTGAPSQFLRPTEITALRGAVEVRVAHSGQLCARFAEGDVRCAGLAWSERESSAESVAHRSPRGVPGTAGATSIAVTGESGFALDASGRMQTWGLVDPLFRPDNAAWNVADFFLGNVRSMSAGTTHGCASHLDGGVSCWGLNPNGELGRGQSDINLSVEPNAVVSLEDADAVISGGSSTCAFRRGGRLSCWGHNPYEAFGDGLTDRAQPTPVELPFANARAVGLGVAHLCVLHDDDRVSCRGSNANGALGVDGFLAHTSALAIAGVAGLVTGAQHNCVWLRDGRVACWGANFAGELGVGDTVQRNAPAWVEGVGRIEGMTAGFNQTCAWGEGRVWCWGSNLGGAFGVGETDLDATPLATRW